jgi:short-subunit dehydrogenase
LSFQGKTAVITGASSGIGRAIAAALVAEGATVCLVGRNAARLRTFDNVAPGRVRSYVADLTVDGNVRELSDLIGTDAESVDLLIHSAGIIAIGAVEHAPVEDLDRQYRINLRAPYLLTQLLLPMVARNQGHIVFLNSLVGLEAKANSSQYSATKHALRALADSLRQEVADRGIRVLSVFLGRSSTPMQSFLNQLEDRPFPNNLLIQPTDVARIILNALSLHGSAEVTDVTIRHGITRPQ